MSAMPSSHFGMRPCLNTGPVVVGNMGSARRFDYTMLGAAANLASRIMPRNARMTNPMS